MSSFRGVPEVHQSIPLDRAGEREWLAGVLWVGCFGAQIGR